jgi:hypothetical protein
MNLKNYFDRVVLIHLERRPDRLAQVKKNLRAAHWPFRAPEVFPAVDGAKARPPVGWRYGPGAWGCLQSHRTVLQQAIDDGVQSLLVLEDDICFAKNFSAKAKQFLRAVPPNWDQLMLGGQHVNLNGPPALVKPGIYRCTDCERTHAYAIRGEFMHKLCERLAGGGRFNGLAINDWIMGRDPSMQLSHHVYAPEFFLVGQERSHSDVYGGVQPRKFWNPPGPDLHVVNLHAPAAVAVALQTRGLCFGRGLGRERNLDQQLAKLFAETKKNSPVRVERLRDWIKAMQWELASDPSFVCAIWHPEATRELAQSASLWPVCEVTAATAEEGVAQLKHSCVLPRLTTLSATAK